MMGFSFFAAVPPVATGKNHCVIIPSSASSRQRVALGGDPSVIAAGLLESNRPNKFTPGLHKSP